MANRTQTKYKKAWCSQTKLTDVYKLEPQERHGLGQSSSVKAESNEELVFPARSSPLVQSEDDNNVPIRQETPEILLEFLDQEIRQESTTPPPLYFDDDVDHSEPDILVASSLALSRKRHANVKITEVEDEDAPGSLKSRELTHSGSMPLRSVDENVDPDTGVECWEEELAETLLPALEI